MVQQASTSRLHAIMAFKNQLVGDMEATSGLPPGSLGYRVPPSPVVHSGPLTSNNIRIDRSVVGAVNTGNIQRLKVSLREIQNGDGGPIASALADLAKTVLRSRVLDDEAKVQAVEQIAFLKTQASLAGDQRQRSVVRPVVEHLGRALAAASDVATIWMAVQPLLARLFQIA